MALAVGLVVLIFLFLRNLRATLIEPVHYPSRSSARSRPYL
ncbi:MAG: hypothetical protein U1E17_13420 [Geminicoccaceae bacterium]